MILKKNEEALELYGEYFTVGATVYANQNSAFKGLVGKITEIRDGKDKLTDNTTPDIYCDFELPISFNERKKVLERLDASYLKELVEEDGGLMQLTGIIMAPQMLITSRYKQKDKAKVYILEEKWTYNNKEGHKNTHVLDIFTDLETAKANMQLTLYNESKDGIIAQLKQSGETKEKDEYYGELSDLYDVELIDFYEISSKDNSDYYLMRLYSKGIDTRSKKLADLKYTKILYVEDGSVDVDDLKNSLPSNIKVIVYRNGSQEPTLIDI